MKTTAPPIESDALTVRQVATALACSRRTVLRAIAAGHLAAVRVGPRGDYRIPAASLGAWARPARPAAPRPTDEEKT